MWRNLLPKEVREVNNIYNNSTTLEVLPYTFILAIESIKYIEGLVELDKEVRDKMTLSQIQSYLTIKGVSENLIVELDSLRVIRNNMAHNLYTVNLSSKNLDLFEEYLAILDSIVESILSELGIERNSYTETTQIFSKK